jgi:hypothetical protein
MIVGESWHGQNKDVVEFFHGMDSFTDASVLSACINFVDLEQCNQNHEKKTHQNGI